MEDNELIALLDRKFAESEERMNARFAQMDAKIDDVKIELGAQLDDMDAKIEQVAEGVAMVDEKLERFRRQTARNFKDVKKTIGVSNAAINERLIKLEKKAS